MNNAGVILIIAIIIYFAVYYPQSASVININGIMGTTEKSTTNTTTVVTEEVDLCNLFQPYIVAGDVANQCEILGGDWVCEEDRVGCYDAPAGSIDCTGGGAMISAFYQCDSVGARPTCDSSNLICYY